MSRKVAAMAVKLPRAHWITTPSNLSLENHPTKAPINAAKIAV